MTKDGKAPTVSDRRGVDRLDKANAILAWLPILGLPVAVLWRQGALDGIWLVATLLLCALCPLGQWYCRERADRIEGTHDRRRKERDDGMRAATDQDLTSLLGS